MLHYSFYPTDALNYLHDQKSINQVEIINIRTQIYIQEIPAQTFLPVHRLRRCDSHWLNLIVDKSYFQLILL